MNEIKAYVNDILEDLHPDDLPLEEPINWGDLKCNEVKQTILVTIDEAAPDCSYLQQYIYRKLKEKYPDKDFEVHTEW